MRPPTALAGIALTLAALLLTSSLVAAPTSPFDPIPDPSSGRLEALSTLGGATRAVAGTGHGVLLGEGTNLVTAETAPGRPPKLAGRLALPGHPRIIEVNGTLAAVRTSTYADGYGPGMQLVDIQDLAHPLLVGSYETAVMPAIFERLAFISLSDGLHVVDTSDPARPQERGVYTGVPYSYDVQLSWPLLVLSDGPRLHTLQVSGSGQLTPLGVYEAPESIRDVVLGDNLAYLLVGPTLRVVDLSSPASPAERASLGLPSQACGLARGPTRLLITANCPMIGSPTTLISIDTTEPAAPALLGSYEVPSGVARVAPLFDTALVAANTAGLLIIDINRSGPPVLLGQYQTQGSATDVVDAGFGRAYLAVESRGLEVVALSLPAPWLEWSLRLIGNVQRVYAEGGLVLAQSDSAFEVLDMRRGDVPAVLLHVELSLPQDLWFDVDGRYAYIGRFEERTQGDTVTREAVLLILDAGGPLPLVLSETRAALPAGATAAQFERAGATVLVASGTDALLAIDVADPQRPYFAGTTQVWDGAVAVQMSGARAYVLTGAGTAQVYGVGPDSDVRLLGGYRSADTTRAMRVVGSTLYLSGDTSFEIVDLSDPAAPAQQGSVAIDGGRQIHVVGNRVFLVDYRSVWGSGMSAVITPVDVADRRRPRALTTVIHGGAVQVLFANGVMASRHWPRFQSIPLSGWLSLAWQPSSGGQYTAAPIDQQAWHALPALPSGLAVDGGYVFVAAGGSGLRMYRFWLPVSLPWIT